MSLDMRPFPDLPTSLLTLIVWVAAMLLLTGTLATTRHLKFSEAAVRFKYLLTALGAVGAFHAMAGFRAAQFIAAAVVTAYALLWLLARTLPLSPRAEAEPTPGQR